MSVDINLTSPYVHVFCFPSLCNQGDLSNCMDDVLLNGKLSDVTQCPKNNQQNFCGQLKFKKKSYSKTCVKWPFMKRPKICFQDQLSLNAGQKYCRMLQVEHSAILSTFIKLPFVIKIFVLSIFEWPFYTGFNCLLCA